MLVKPIINWPGTPTSWSARQRSRFGSEWSSTLALLTRELDQVNANARILQVDIDEDQFRIDGFPRANARQRGPGVIITFDAFRTTLSYPCDTFDHWHDNVRAIALALEALRKVDRYGVTKRGEQYQGFKALPPGSIAIGSTMTFDQAAREFVQSAGLDIWDEGLRRIVKNDSGRRAELYRQAAKRLHPDMDGGSAEDFKRLTDAKTVLDRGPVVSG